MATRRLAARATAPDLLAARPWPVSELVPHPRNARVHSDEQIKQLANAITKFGWTMPVLVDENGMILAGHGRVMAAKLLGMETVPVVVATGWTDAQKRAYVIADNKIAANSSWDAGLLAAELKDLAATGTDLSTLGFEAGDLNALLGPPPEPKKSRGLGTPIIHYDIVFDTEGQQQTWFAFLTSLRLAYPDAETIAERLTRYLAAQQPPAPATNG